MNWKEDTTFQLPEYFRDITIIDPPLGVQCIRAWKATIRPFPAGRDIPLVASDLQQDRIVSVGLGGSLHHFEDCTSPHEVVTLPSASVLDRSYTVLVVEREAPKHPLAFSVSPSISRIFFPNHPHLLFERILWRGRRADGLCLYRPDEFQPGSILDYFFALAIFMAKHTIWAATRKLYCLNNKSRIDIAPAFWSHALCEPEFTPAIGSLAVPYTTKTPGMSTIFESGSRGYIHAIQGNWLGSFAPHDVSEITAIRANRECYCLSGLPFGECHREELRRNQNWTYLEQR